MRTFPLAEPTIGKLFRVRPYATTSIVGGDTQSTVDLFRILEVTFPDAEEYPADVVSLTPWTKSDGYLQYCNQVVLEINTNNVAVTFKIQADGADKATLTVTSTEADRQRTITLPSGLTGYRWRITCDPAQNAIAVGAGMFQLFNYAFKLQRADLGEVVHTKDWDDLGHPYDKKLYTATLRWDNTGGAEVVMVMDILKGINGGTLQAGVATFTLPAASGRSEKTFALPDGIIAKAIRIYPQGATLPTGFRSWGYEVQKENYPPDIVAFTPLEDGGYEYDKFCNQVDFEVNTNNVAVTVKIQADGADKATFTITSTESDRRRNITLPTALSGKKWRIFVDPTQAAITSGGAMWQLFSHRFAFQPADKGEVAHTFDWDDLGHPWDKLLLNVTFEYDTTAGAVTLQMDTLSGIGGVTATSNVAQFALGSGRGKTTFPLPADTIAKMVRVYPLGTPPAGYKQWKYTFDKVDYPADKVRVTPWKDASAPVDKEPSWLWIDADTSGVAASVQLQNEAGTVITVNHTGTSSNRKKNYPITADTRAKMWRLVAAEGGGGRFQLFDWGFERWQPFPLAGPVDPPESVLCTPWQDFGYPFEKMAKALILTINTGGVACSVALQTNEAGTVATFPVTTTNTTRRVVLSCPANLQGTMWRLVLTPGSGGIAQLWDWSLDAMKMPPKLTRWSSYGQGLGYAGWKFFKQFFMDYVCAGTINVTFTSDTGSVTFTLPIKATRNPERRLFAAVWGAGLNKSKLLGVDIVANDSTKPFQMWMDMSEIEWLPCGADRHTAYAKAKLSSFMETAV
jgi:hypothetical protein